MVSFVCDACQETIKRPKVAAHGQRCRACWRLSCVDCGRSFEGTAYMQHTTCVSEAQKYQGALFKGDPVAKGERKQQQWMAEARARAAHAPADIRRWLDQIAALQNVPRKRSKFANFVRNSIGLRRESDIDRIWQYLQGDSRPAGRAGEEPGPRAHRARSAAASADGTADANGHADDSTNVNDGGSNSGGHHANVASGNRNSGTTIPAKNKSLSRDSNTSSSNNNNNTSTTNSSSNNTGSDSRRDDDAAVAAAHARRSRCCVRWLLRGADGRAMAHERIVELAAAVLRAQTAAAGQQRLRRVTARRSVAQAVEQLCAKGIVQQEGAILRLSRR